MSTQYSLLGWLSANAVGGSTSVTPIGTTNNAWNDLEVLPTGANGAIYWIGWDLDEFEDTLLLPCGLRPKGSSLGTSSYRFDPEHVVDPQEVGILLPCAAGTSNTTQYYRSSTQVPTRIIRVATFYDSGEYTTLSIDTELSLSTTATVDLAPGEYGEAEIGSELDISTSVEQIYGPSLSVDTELDISIDVYQSAYSNAIVENITNSSSLDFEQLLNQTTTEDIDIAETIEALALTNILNSIELTDILNSQGNLNTSVLDISTVDDKIYILYPIVLSDDIEIDFVLEELKGLLNVLIDNIDLNDTRSTSIYVYNNIYSNIDIISELNRYILNTIDDDITINILDVLELQYNSSNEDNINISLSLLSILKLYLNNTENITIDNIQQSSSILHSNIIDSLDMNIIIDLDGTTYSGWILNPENYAISNYSFGFTDSTLFKTSYLLADSGGLYEFGESTDNSDAIESEITTASFDLNSGSIKQIPKVLIGTNGTSIVLKVSIDGSYTAYYELNSPIDCLSTKDIDIGKGLIGKNWQFTLTTKNNSDMDIDTFEFFPIIFKRKH